VARQEKEGGSAQHEEMSERITVGTAADLDLDSSMLALFYDKQEVLHSR